MSQYYLLFIFCFVMAFLAAQSKRKSKNVHLFLILGAIFVFFGFRVTFTLDDPSYKDYFTYGVFSDNHDNEPLFLWAIALLSWGKAVLLQTILFCLCLYIVMKLYVPSKYWWLVIAILFLNVDFLIGFFSGYRSCFVAMGLFVSFWLKNKIQNKTIALAYGVGIMSITSLMHSSGIFMIPVLFVPDKAVSKPISNVVLLVSIIFVLLSTLFANLINSYATSLIAGYAEEYMVYMADSIADQMMFSIPNMVSLASRLYLFYYTFGWMKTKVEEPVNGFITLSAVFFIISLAPAVGLIARFFLYFMFPVLVAIPYMMRKEKSQTKKLLFYGSLLVFLFLKYRIMRLGGYFDLMNYVSSII